MENNKFATQFKQLYPTDLRKMLRSSGLSVLYGLYKASGQIPPLLFKNRIQFIYFHHVLKEEEDNFHKILQILSRDHNFISYSEAVDRILKGEIDRPYIVISFDDGLKSCLRAAHIMKKYGAKGCFFICPEMVGETGFEKIKEFCATKLNKPPLEFLSWDDIEKLLKEGHEVGSHTMTHSNLAQLSIQEVQDEIGGSFDALTKKNGQVRHFSWPAGRFFHFSAKAAEIVFESGFISCASAERGCHSARAEGGYSNLCIRRDDIKAKWPLHYLLYFLARSSQMASEKNNQWPENWVEVVK